MSVFASILATERRLQEPICSFTPGEGYTVYQSERYPRFCGGNGIEIDDPRDRSLADWEELFVRYFQAGQYEHKTFTYPDAPPFARITEEARAGGYHVTSDIFLALDHTRLCRGVPEGYEVGQVRDEGGYARIMAGLEIAFCGEDWYTPGAAARLFTKTRHVSDDTGMEWWYLRPRDKEDFAAWLAIFCHQGVGRVEDVATLPSYRRRGLAGALVSFAVRRLLENMGAKVVALDADEDYHAIELYRKLGFAEVGRRVALMKYPVQNPAPPGGSSGTPASPAASAFPAE